MKNNNHNTKFYINRIYVKDISFESPNTPKIFQIHWNPKIDIKININSTKINNTIYEVILFVTVITLIEKNIAFLCQVKKAGLFTIIRLNETQMTNCLQSYCPNILFPYAQECINNQVSRGTFPQINLNPINFDLLLQKNP